MVTVTDHGEGLARDVARRSFDEPFSTGEGVLRKEKAGVGRRVAPRPPAGGRARRHHVGRSAPRGRHARRLLHPPTGCARHGREGRRRLSFPPRWRCASRWPILPRGPMRRAVLGIAVAITCIGCAAASPTDPLSVAEPIRVSSTASPFSHVTAGPVAALVPEGWTARPASDDSFRGGFLASPQPDRWSRMDGGVAGMSATWVDATVVGMPSDFYYLAATGPVLSSAHRLGAVRRGIPRRVPRPTPHVHVGGAVPRRLRSAWRGHVPGAGRVDAMGVLRRGARLRARATRSASRRRGCTSWSP